MIVESNEEETQLSAKEAVNQMDSGKHVFSTDKGYENFIFMKLKPSTKGRKYPTEEDMKTPYVLIHNIEAGGTTEGRYSKEEFLKEFSKTAFVVKDKSNWWGYKIPLK